MTAAFVEKPILPPADSQVLLEFSNFLLTHPQSAFLVGPEGTQVEIPIEIHQVLLEVVDAMKRGQAINLAPHNQMLTTQEAANILGISRPSLVKLLESNQIPFQQVGSSRHRKLQLSDVLAYQNKSRVNRKSALDELTHLGAQEGFYSDATPEYQETLKNIRRNR